MNMTKSLTFGIPGYSQDYIIYYIIAKKIINSWTSPKRVLDIGCGTGFQSLLYAKSGAEVTGIDISDRLIEVAKRKLRHFNPLKPISFFEPKFKFVAEYENRINHILEKLPQRDFKQPKFVLGDAQNIAEESGSFDHINCCGSTFSFIDDYQSAITEIHRCLKPDGTFIFEVESKNNLDLFWPLFDSTIFFGKLEYETGFKEAVSQSFGSIGKHIEVEYPFGDVKNPVYMNIRLFKKKKLIKELAEAGLYVERCYTIHSITNMIPSTILDSENPGFFTKAYFRLLRKLEEKFPFNLPGCSLVLIGRKI
ncbi:ubiquinone/menaquinone biosynthesis C-methylase UbiE [Pedobacter sp. AK017]|uniref:class I SAM-dependent methyltransferase n=1 Tax=Pedobacter sp. AK017 TaxID=2723073 RepID=UPI0016205C95|nr:class I SAM-dependent methyltransferase [Pedobacter sp. AK017]MBB5436916.1 ubiquinone/menaquinone biosynthesis C-methylase UbiE [Pedobacter sp. AK017]